MIGNTYYNMPKKAPEAHEGFMKLLSKFQTESGIIYVSFDRYDEKKEIKVSFKKQKDYSKFKYSRSASDYRDKASARFQLLPTTDDVRLAATLYFFFNQNNFKLTIECFKDVSTNRKNELEPYQVSSITYRRKIFKLTFQKYIGCLKF